MRHDELVRDAYLRLFPGQDFLYAVRVSFSSRFTPYNASIRYTAAEMRFRLSSAWRGVSEEILIGLLQMLILKALREKRDSVTLSSLLRREPLLLDYVLYHELLHRVLKYQPCGGSARYHTAEFRARERQFENAQEMEMRVGGAS